MGGRLTRPARTGSLIRVRCEPSGRVVEVPEGATLFAGLRSAEMPIASACAGDGICGRCGVRVLSGTLAPPSPQELRVAERQRVAPGERVSCLVVPEGDLVVTTPYW